MSLNLLRGLEGQFVGDRLHALLAELLEGGWVVAEVKLGADQNDWNIRCVMLNLWIPLREESAMFRGLGVVSVFTFALTLSKDGGETMEKQIKKTSVCG